MMYGGGSGGVTGLYITVLYQCELLRSGTLKIVIPVENYTPRNEFLGWLIITLWDKKVN